MNDKCVIIDRFHEIVRPRVYQEMHHITAKLIHMQMQELTQGEEFPKAAEKFLSWCKGEETLFCTWGALDLMELQRNLRFYNMTPMSDGPIAFLDVQKLFAIAYEDGKQHRSLEYAIDYLQIDKEIPFHRAFSDAYYTARVLAVVKQNHPEVLQYVSFDVFHPPADRSAEVKVQFATYTKYISRKFADKAQAFADKEVASTKCYLCHRNLRKKLRWFGVNGKHYYAVAYCEKHGYLKAKNRFRKSDDGMVYVVKTTKFISEEEFETIKEKSQHVKELRKKRKYKE